MSDRPNLVLFMPDQLRADAVGCFGSTVAQTPVIDALAARGARFDHAYVQHSVCSPSRASIFTGWYPHVAGHRSLTHLLKPWEPNLLRSLKEAGYTVAWVGQRGDTFAPGVVAESTDFHGFLVEPAVFLEASPHPPDSPWQGAFYHGRRQSPPGEVVLDFDEATEGALGQEHGEAVHCRPGCRCCVSAVALERTGGGELVDALLEEAERVGTGDAAAVVAAGDLEQPGLVQDVLHIGAARSPEATHGGRAPIA